MADNKPKANAGRILLVDDEEPIRESLGELLTACGFEVLTADSYKSAVKILEQSIEIEAVLSDLKMPGKSGLDVLRYVNDNKKDIPLLFLTGYGTLETCQEALKEGAFDYILKPVDSKDKVVLPLSHAVEKYRLEKTNRQIRQDIIRMAEEHQKLIDTLLQDADVKDKIQEKIAKILDKWQPLT
jgi:DNA-binding NtrC family response regulator